MVAPGESSAELKLSVALFVMVDVPVMELSLKLTDPPLIMMFEFAAVEPFAKIRGPLATVNVGMLRLLFSMPLLRKVKLSTAKLNMNELLPPLPFSWNSFIESGPKKSVMVIVGRKELLNVATLPRPVGTPKVSQLFGSLYSRLDAGGGGARGGVKVFPRTSNGLKKRIASKHKRTALNERSFMVPVPIFLFITSLPT